MSGQIGYFIPSVSIRKNMFWQDKNIIFFAALDLRIPNLIVKWTNSWKGALEIIENHGPDCHNQGKVYQLKAFCFSFFTVPQFYTRVFFWVGSQNGDASAVIPMLLTCHSRIEPSSSGRLGACSLLCKDLIMVIHWEISDLELTINTHYLQILIDVIQDRVCQTDSLIIRFRDVLDNFLHLLSPPVKMWQQILGYMAFLKRFVPRGRVRMPPF